MTLLAGAAAARLAAQAPPEASLEDLIPDAAVADPEGWAAAAVPGDAAREEDNLAAEALAGTAADAELAELPGLTLDWPGELALDPVAPLEPPEEFVFEDFSAEIPPTPAGREERISRELVLVLPAEPVAFPEEQEFLSRFRQLSSIADLDDEGAIGRLAAQARADEDLLLRLLRVYGYFDAQVIREVGHGPSGPDEETRLEARFVLLPGVRYRVAEVDLGAIDETGADAPALRAAFGVETGQPILLDEIEQGRFDVDLALAEGGYPFATVPPPGLVVDHDRDVGDVSMPVAPNGRYVFGNVRSERPDFLSSRHLDRIARFEPGELYRRSDADDLRQAILATGLVSTVSVRPVAVREPVGAEPGVVDMEVALHPAPLRTLAANIGFGTGEGIRVEGSWEHRNLFPPEGMLRLRGIAGTREQLAGITFRRNNFRGRDRVLTADLYASTIDYEAYDARTVSLLASYEQLSTVLFQKPLAWSVGLELVATSEAERDADRNLILPRETYFVAALPLYAQLDTSDDLLDPTEGWRLGARLSPEAARNEGVQSFYLRSQVDASYYRQIGENVVLAGRARFASIPGAPVEAIAPSRRLYAGGGGSVRGYGFRQIGPRNDEGDPIGGRSLTELSLEARIRTGFLDGALGIVPFIDAGSVGSDALPGFDSIKFGAGIGIRYNTGFGPIRVDVAVPLNPGPNDSWVAVYVALGQSF